MNDFDLINAVLASTESNLKNGGAIVISEQHDLDQINWVNGLSDPGEMIACGYLPEIRRRSGEKDKEYAVRIRPIVMALPKEQRDKIMSAAVDRMGLNVSPDGKVAYVGVGNDHWHGLGVGVAEALNSDQALHLGRLAGWDLKKVPLVYLDNQGNRRESGSFAIVRGDNGECLTYGTSVGSRYHIFSNEEAFDFMDVVVQAGAKYDTAGALGKGEKVWMQMKWPEEISIAGEEHSQYLMFFGTHDGTGAIRVLGTDQRAVCRNTTRLALLNKGKDVAIRHTKNARDKVRQVQEALGLAGKKFETYAEYGNYLAQKPLAQPVEYFHGVLDCLTDTEIAEYKATQENMEKGIILKAIETTLKGEEREKAEKSLERAQRRRKVVMDDILERFESERNNGNRKIKGSAWAGYNTMTEFAQHSPLVRYQGNEQERKEARFESILNGQALEVQRVAMNAAMAK